MGELPGVYVRTVVLFFFSFGSRHAAIKGEILSFGNVSYKRFVNAQFSNLGILRTEAPSGSSGAT